MSNNVHDHKALEGKSKSFKMLRQYVSIYHDKNITRQSSDITDKYSISKSTLDNYSSGNGISMLNWDKAKLIGNYYIDLEAEAEKKGEGNFNLFRVLIQDFIENCYEDELMEESAKEYTSKILSRKFGYVPGEDTYSDKGTPQKNLDEEPESGIIRKNLKQEIIAEVNVNKLVFVYGYPGTGKSFLVQKIAHEYYKEKKYNLVWISGQTTLTFNDFLIENVRTFNKSLITTMSPREKQTYVEEMFSKRKVLIVLDDFHDMPSEERKSILKFLMKIKSEKMRIIITSNDDKKTIQEQVETSYRAHYVHVKAFNPEEWQQLANTCFRREQDVCAAQAVYPALNDVVYRTGGGNPYVMCHLLCTLSNKIMSGAKLNTVQEPELKNVDPDAYKYILNKTITDLPQDCVSVLVTLSLFATPIDSDRLGTISGLNDCARENGEKALTDAVDKCRHQLLIENGREGGNKQVTFVLNQMVRPVIASKMQEAEDKHQGIIDRWIRMYVEMANGIGFCFTEFEKLNCLDAETKNIQNVLRYCENNQRYLDYYKITQGIRYFFYTRGISGEGENSVHYKRAKAAEKLGMYIQEHESLVYFCNVSCKAKSWDMVEESFRRIAKLEKMCAEIPETERLKAYYGETLYYFLHGTADKKMVIDRFVRYEERLRAGHYWPENCEGLAAHSNENLMLHDYIASLRWHCECIYSVVEENPDSEENQELIKEADAMLREAIRLSRQICFLRSVVHALLIRIKFAGMCKQPKSTFETIFEELNGEDLERVISSDTMYSKEYTRLKKQYDEAIGTRE